MTLIYSTSWTVAMRPAQGSRLAGLVGKAVRFVRNGLAARAGAIWGGPPPEGGGKTPQA